MGEHLPGPSTSPLTASFTEHGDHNENMKGKTRKKKSFDKLQQGGTHTTEAGKQG